MYSKLIMMCNVIMTLYDAAVERRAGRIRYKLLVYVNLQKWRLGGWKTSVGRWYRASEKSGVKLSTNRSKILIHKRTRNEQVQHGKMHNVTSPYDSRFFPPYKKYPAFKTPSPTYCLVNLSASTLEPLNSQGTLLILRQPTSTPGST